LKWLILGLLFAWRIAAARSDEAIIHSARSGAWSSPKTWEGGKLPGAGARVQIRAGHRVTYDVSSATVIRAIHVAGTLAFARDRDTRLDVGLIKIQAGDDASEDGAECDRHGSANDPIPALEVGTPEAPISAGHTALIRLAAVAGQDPHSCPAILTCGGRMDFHGAPLGHSWVKLGATGEKGARSLKLAEPVTGWRAGDFVIVTTTDFPTLFTKRPGGGRRIPSILEGTQTEEARIVRTSRDELVLDHPLKFEHTAEGRYRGEVADLSRNVIVESAAPDGVRGHTMYHHGSSGSVSYAEFRHLGKKGVLARYPIHFHKLRDSMRGTQVVGASVWDSDNRFITIHGTDYVVVRDTVGYRSVGHGFFLEDGSEELNLLDRNLAVQAMLTDPLPDQALPTDLNDGAGFWWANSRNAFVRNVAVECSMHGFRYQISKTPTAPVDIEVRQDDGSMKRVDVRRLPFLRFESNEAHSQRRFTLNLGGFNALGDDRDQDRDGNVNDRTKFLGGDVQGVGPDDHHPFVIRDFLSWRSQWGFHAGAPNVRVDGLDVYQVEYGIWRSNVAGHEYVNTSFRKMGTVDVQSVYASGDDRYDFLRYLHLEDTQPPVTVITSVRRAAPDRIEVSGVAADDNGVPSVMVNGRPATVQPGLLANWTASIPVTGERVSIEAVSKDRAGNGERTPHRLVGTIGDLRALRSVAVVLPANAAKPVAQDEPDQKPPDHAAAAREMAAAAAMTLRSPSRWRLWDGKESIADYARAIGLPPTRAVEIGGEKLDLVLVPAGRFTMGSPSDEPGRSDDEGPPRAVLISAPFYMARTEVTQAQYEAVMGANPSYFRGRDLPVEQVSWNDATAFVAKAGHGVRLPTEAQWEMACRAGTKTAFSSGSDASGLDRAAWFSPRDYAQSDDGVRTTHAVGQKSANALGLFDMHGNVYEWCQDWYAPDAYRRGAEIDPAGPASGYERVLRGGSWESPASVARSANRNGYPPASRGYTIGFRVVQPVDAR
jgi:formylglycine-generating enzyme required for sulfatase activity